MKAYDIVAYTYQAQTICPTCALGAANYWLAEDGVKVPYLVAEDALNAWATSAKIDREDEYTFDTDDFPKVVFAAQIDSQPEACNECWDAIL